jgi:hypothetical protein
MHESLFRILKYFLEKSGARVSAPIRESTTAHVNRYAMLARRVDEAPEIWRTLFLPKGLV